MCLVHEAKIRELWKAIVWAVDNILERRFVLDGDAYDILTLFMHSVCIPDHPLLQNARMLSSYFLEVCVFYAWREKNMCANFVNFVAGEGSRLDTKVIWHKNFSQLLAVMKDVSSFCYE